MATAEFPAEYVFDRAVERIVEVEAQCAAARAEKLSELESRPVTTGSLWWKRQHYRTKAEAVAAYEKVDDSWYSIEDRVEGKFHDRIAAIRPLERISAAAIQACVRTVSLDASDCKRLEIPMKRAA